MLKLSKGNSKIGNIMNVSLTPVKACRGADKVCSKDCYALKAYRQYPATKAAWDSNYILANDFPELYFLAISQALEKYKGEYFRWHVAGDILNYNYFCNMVAIAKAFPKIKFLAFTKQYEIVNRWIGKNMMPPANLSIILSAWPGHPIDDWSGYPIAYVRDKKGVEDRIVPHAETKGPVFECPGSCTDCKWCWDAKLGTAVVFNQH